MFFRFILAVVTAVMILALPSAASAASVGMSSTVIIPSPHKLVAGQTQYASYAVTAGTRPAKITVEWYRIRNPRLSADFDHNREVVVPEKSLGNSMTGGDTYTIPANPVAGHYGVMFRYYAQSTTTVGASTYTIPGNIEATANNSFYVENVDVCPNIVGSQASVPANHTLVGGNCLPDVCPNLEGVQTSAPANHALVDGNCLPDVCPNLKGVQTSVPANHALVGGNCLPDMCPNLEGVQTEVPQGMVMEGGQCVAPPAPPIVIPATPIPAPPVTPIVPQVATPVGRAGKPRLTITKRANRMRVKQGQNVRFIIRVKNTGSAAAINTRVCDLVPAGMVYVKHTRKAVFERGGRICWTIKRINKGKTVTVGVLTAKITRAKGRVINRACIMKGKTMRTEKCARATVTVTAHKPQPTGGVTG